MHVWFINVHTENRGKWSSFFSLLEYLPFSKIKGYEQLTGLISALWLNTPYLKLVPFCCQKRKPQNDTFRSYSLKCSTSSFAIYILIALTKCQHCKLHQGSEQSQTVVFLLLVPLPLIKVLLLEWRYLAAWHESSEYKCLAVLSQDGKVSWLELHL